MKRTSVVFVAIALSLVAQVMRTTQAIAQQGLWATAYYAGWMQGWSNNGHLPAQAVDYSAVTHIVHFSLVPNADGSLNPDANSITTINSTELVTRAHAAAKKVLICVGGAGSDGGFRGASSVTYRATFIANLVAFMTARGYDGIDIDWEPLYSSDAAQFTALIAGLRTALNAVTPRPLLTAAAAWESGILAQVQQHFDQINIMTYDLSGPWQGWVTWHNAPIYDGGFVFPSTGGPVPSIDRMVDGFIASGVAAAKLGIGIDFYGYIWSGGDGTPTGGATEPRQSWSVAPSRSFEQPYHTIMQNYYQPGFYRWDAAAQAAYLRIDNAGSASDMFISYDNEISVQRKFDYARSKGIGGLIVWELGGGYMPTMPVGQRDLLLQAVKIGLTGGSLPIQLGSFTATANGANRVRLDWSTISETNNYGFEVQRSAGTPDNYQTLPNSFVPGHGTTNVPQFYVHTDSSAGAGSWYYRLKQIDLDQTVHYTDGVHIDVLTGVLDKSLPTEYTLEQNYPNPFNPSTSIVYSLPEASDVSLKIYNVLGEEVATLVSETLPAGKYKATWNATAFASGFYVYRLSTKNFSETKKLLLTK